MRILHVVAGLAEEGGGLSELVPRMALAEARLGNDVTLATRACTSMIVSESAREAAKGGVRIIQFVPSFPGFIYFSWQMYRGLDALIKDSDVVHVHGNWTFPVWFACRCAIRNGRTLVMSPQGSFDPVRLAHSAWKKRLASFFDLRCLRHADVIHATAERERTWIESFGGAELGKKTIIIPNGTEFAETQREAHGEETHRLVYLGRLHPLKGLDLLLPAIKSLPSSWSLIVAGPDEQGTLDGLKQQSAKLGVSDRVEFRGPVYGADKWQLIAQADCVVLPTRSENFGIIVAEALSCGVPVVCTKGAPWRGLVEHSCGWWCDVSEEGLSSSLSMMADVSASERAEMGQRGKLWVHSEFKWSSIAERMISVYAKTMQSISQNRE